MCWKLQFLKQHFVQCLNLWSRNIFLYWLWEKSSKVHFEGGKNEMLKLLDTVLESGITTVLEGRAKLEEPMSPGPWRWWCSVLTLEAVLPSVAFTPSAPRAPEPRAPGDASTEGACAPRPPAERGCLSSCTDCKHLDKPETAGDRRPGDRPPGGRRGWAWPRVARLLVPYSSGSPAVSPCSTPGPSMPREQQTSPAGWAKTLSRIACRAAGHRDPQLLHAPRPHGFLAPASCLCWRISMVGLTGRMDAHAPST